MKTRWLRLKIIALLVIGLSVWSPTTLFATNSLESFSATITVPDNQVGSTSSYFDILQPAGTTTELSVTLTNNQSENLNLALSFHRAITNLVGVVEYSGSNTDLSEPTNNIEDIVTLSDTQVSLAPGETRQISLTVTMPQATFDGILAGGLYIAAETNTAENSNVNQRFSREIAVILQENDAAVTPSLSFEAAEATQQNGRNGVNITINNQAAAYLNQVSLDYTITHNGETLVTETANELQFAPSSRFNYYLSLADQQLAAGDYQVAITATSGEQNWTDTLDFSVSNQEAEELNETSVAATPDSASGFNWLSLIIILATLIFLAVIIWLVYKNQQLKKQMRQKKRKRKKGNKKIRRE